MQQDMNVLSGFTVSQRAAVCFAAGVVGAAAVVLFSHVLFGLGLSATLGINAPVSLKSPDIYKPLFWGGLWGILFGLFTSSRQGASALQNIKQDVEERLRMRLHHQQAHDSPL